MTTLTKTSLGMIVAASLALAAGCDCTADDTNETAEGTGSTGNTTNTTNTTSTTNTTTVTSADTGTSASTSATSVDTTATSESSTAGSSSTTVDPNEFQFNPTPPDQYTRVDRKGFPAVNTGLHIHGDKDVYNANDPVNDVTDYFDDSSTEAAESLDLLHYGPDLAPGGPSGLDDELNTFMLESCSNAFGVVNCVDQGSGALVYPDTLKINTSLPAGFSIDPATCGPIANGRALDNPVIDIILAALMLDLGAAPPDMPAPGFGLPCDPNDPMGARSAATTFMAIPDGAGGTFSLNPSANDSAFSDAFPYLADPHTP